MDVVPKRIRTVNSEDFHHNGDDPDGIDLISDLPNEILCHILSFLPTKNAVGTSVLSTRWKNLFPLIPNLKIRISDFSLMHPDSASETNLINFKNFVDKLLNVTLRGAPSIFGLCLVCQKFSDGQEIAKWIDAALHLNINRVDLRLVRLRNSNFIFDSLFGANITVLNLLLDFADNAPEYKFSMPNLKVMSVQCMRANGVNALLEGCPVLVYLVLYNCYCAPGEVLRVCNPSLRALKFYNGMKYFHGDLKLDAPKLEFLLYEGFLPNRYLARRIESLQTAHLLLDESISLYPYGFNVEVAVLINICSCVEKLWVSKRVIKMFHRFPPPLVMFQSLVHVGIEKMDSYGWELLPVFLNSSPNLKNLFMRSGFDNKSYESFKTSLDRTVSVTLSPHGNESYNLEFERKVEN